VPAVERGLAEAHPPRRAVGHRMIYLPSPAGTPAATMAGLALPRWGGVAGGGGSAGGVDPTSTTTQPIGAPAAEVGCKHELGVQLQGVTAHYLAYDSYPIQKGDWVVVHAAAGGVGNLLTQIARLLGARVIATTSTEDKARLAREAGADEVLGYQDFAQRAREIAGSDGVAAVYDGVGKTTFYEGLRALRPFGKMIIFGASSGQPDPLDVMQLARAGSLYVQRPTLATYTRTPELLRDRAARVFDLVEHGRLKIRIGARYKLAEARQAHVDLEGRKTAGKIVLLP